MKSAKTKTLSFKQKVQKVLADIRPNIQLDGGDVAFISADEKTGLVKIKFQGACVGCPISPITLQAGIFQSLKSKIPEVKEVVPVDETGEENF